MKLIILIREFVKDMRSGYTDSELMEKYRISEKQLQIVFRRLAERNLIDPDEVPALRPEHFEETIVFDKGPEFGWPSE